MTSIDIFYQGEHIREIEHIEIDDGSSVGAVGVKGRLHPHQS